MWVRCLSRHCRVRVPALKIILSWPAVRRRYNFSPIRVTWAAHAQRRSSVPGPDDISGFLTYRSAESCCAGPSTRDASASQPLQRVERGSAHQSFLLEYFKKVVCVCFQDAGWRQAQKRPVGICERSFPCFLAFIALCNKDFKRGRLNNIIIHQRRGAATAKQAHSSKDLIQLPSYLTCMRRNGEI